MDSKSLIKSIDRAVQDYRGDLTELERAIGAYMVGLRYGWKPLMLVHDKRTIKKYEKHLGVSFRDSLPEIGDMAMNLRGYRVAIKAGSIWKAIKGEVPNSKGPKVDNGAK